MRRIVRWAGESAGDLGGLVGLTAVVILMTVGSTFVFAWGAVHVHDWIWPPVHHDYYATEVCFVDQGANGLEYVRAPRSYMPHGAVEVPCQ